MRGGDRDPYLDTGMHGFIRNTAIKEFWRVAGYWYDDVTDLMQDGYLCYAKCRARYVDKLGVLPATNPSPDDRRHMMALVRTAFVRHVKFGLTQKIKHGWEVPVSQLVRPGAAAPADPWGVLSPLDAGDAGFFDLVRTLPKELQQLVVVLARDGVEALGFRRSRLQRRVLPNGRVRIVRYRRALRETKNEYYCRLVGLDPRQHDLAGQVERLVRGTT